MTGFFASVENMWVGGGRGGLFKIWLGRLESLHGGSMGGLI